MPEKGCTLVHGERFNPITKKLHTAFIKETGIEISFGLFKNIIETNNDLIGKAISTEPEGVQLPLIGYICVSKYKQRREKPAIDYINTRKQGRPIPLLNLHTFGYIHYIKWFKVGSRVPNLYIWKFQPLRKVKRGLAKEIKSGKQFFEWNTSDLWHSSKLERMFNKKFKKD